MNDFLLVLSYTFRENIRKKAFIISTIIMLLLAMILMILPGVISNSSNDSSVGKKVDTSKITQTFYIIDSMNVFKNDVSPLKGIFPDYKIEIKTPPESDALINKVKEDENSFLLVLQEKAGTPSFMYYYKKFGIGPDPKILEPKVKELYVANLLTQAGADAKLATKILSAPGLTENELGKGAIKGMLLGMLIMFVLFFAIYYFGYGIAMSVASEKTSRVMETLITSTKPSRIIFGKTAAIGLLGLLQLTLILLTAGITYRLFFPKDFSMLGFSLDFTDFTPLVLAMMILYFIFGYLLYAMLNAVAGASVSKAEDVNSAIMPVSMVSLVAFYIAYFPTTIPNTSGVGVITSIFPLTAPFSMPTRLIMDTVPPLELIASIVLLIATILLFAWLSVKIYSVAILHYGNRLRLKDYFRMTKKK